MRIVLFLFVFSLASCVTVPSHKICDNGALSLGGVSIGSCEGTEDMPYKNGEPDWDFFLGA